MSTVTPVPRPPVPRPRPVAHATHRLGPVPARPRARQGTVALTLVVIAGVASLLVSIGLGATMGPMQAAHGGYLFGTPDWYATTAVAALGSQVIWTCMGLAGLGAGITAIVHDRGRTNGILAVILAVAAPVVSYAGYLLVTFIAAPVA